ncbi:MAG TPA: glycosyltransferase family 87 protein, partial [Polyangiaceae bacterium]|nr:glycosyltransferase family 87 protein [Polyangiaceae bacterium]
QPQGMFYPPATAFSMLPFAALPYALGKFVWHSTIVLTVIFGIRSLVRLAMPRAGNHVWMFCAGVVLLSAALRWGMMLLQGAPLVLGMLCFFVAAANGNRPKLAAALAIAAVAVKMTLALPFLGILLLRRRLVPVVAAGATWALLNAAGFAIMGHGAFASYRANVGDLESFGNINAPDPWNPLSLPRLDWTTLLYGVTGHLSLARTVSLGLTAFVALWLLREGLRVRDPLSLQSTSLFLTPLVCLGSLCVYHHQYDAALFFAPALLSALVFGPELRPRWAVYLALPLVAMILLLPIGLVQRIAENTLGLRGVGLLKLAFPVAFNLALLGSLIVLSRSRSEAASGAPASAS